MGGKHDLSYQFQWSQRARRHEDYHLYKNIVDADYFFIGIIIFSIIFSLNLNLKQSFFTIKVTFLHRLSRFQDI